LSTIGLLGLGEAGSLIATDLVAAGAEVRGYDPAVPTLAGVPTVEAPADVAVGADLVLSLSSAADALDAAGSVADHMGSQCVFVDANTAAPERKREVAEALDGIPFADLALMQSVPGRGLKTPALAAGPGAERAVAILGELGMPVAAIGGDVGAAAARKLARSVFVKGMAAAVAESLAAGDALGCGDWLRDDVERTLAAADAATVEHLVTGSRKHAVRRAAEMAAVEAMLTDLGVRPGVTAATRAWLEELAR
jgi:3-hydroxyisobutyrate dehydrogenase-like beta-hydroxyacid dehydrogenase